MKVKIPNISAFFICWFVYMCIYICRVNISVALPGIGAFFEADKQLLGAIGSAFFIVYAIGQLINGILGDSLPSKKFVAMALLGSAIMNFLAGLSGNIFFIMLFWAVNGYFQSMVWGPLMRILSRQYSKEKLRRISVGMSTSMVAGFIITWSVLAQLLGDGSWRFLFILPSIIGFVAWILWLRFIPADAQASFKLSEAINLDRLRSISIKFKDFRLYFVAMACFCLGAIKEGISLWAPILFMEASGMATKSSLWLLMVIPVFNLLGILLAGLLMKKYKQPLHTVLLLFIIVLFSTILLTIFINSNKIIGVVLISTISAMAYGCNTIFLSYIPLTYERENMVSTLVGIFDFSSYIGAAVFSVVIGFVSNHYGWAFIPLIWFVLAAVALGLSAIKSKKDQNMGNITKGIMEVEYN